MTVADLLEVTSDFTPITLLTFWNHEVLAQERKEMKKFKDVEIELLTAGTVIGKGERKGVICAYVREEYADAKENS